MVILYKVTPLSYWLGVRLIKVPFIGLCNLVAEQQVAPELIQHQATPEAISNEICRLFEETDYRHSTVQKLKTVKEKLGGGGASDKTAELALAMLD